MNQEDLKRVQEAKRQIIEESLVLWNTRLNLLAQAGDLRAVLEQMKQSAEDANNCNCNTNCDRPQLGGDLAAQPILTSKPNVGR